MTKLIKLNIILSTLFLITGQAMADKTDAKEIKLENSTSDDSKYSKINKDAALKKLTPIQMKVTQEEGTERAFENEYWDKKEAGIYVDIVSGEPLFSSIDKYDSGTGWPSFSKPIENKFLTTKTDRKLLISGERTEVRSKYANSHLGHVFDDGPAPTNKRYCLNSAALRFIPIDKMEAEGYGKYLYLFKKEKK